MNVYQYIDSFMSHGYSGEKQGERNINPTLHKILSAALIFIKFLISPPSKVQEYYAPTFLNNLTYNYCSNNRPLKPGHTVILICFVHIYPQQLFRPLSWFEPNFQVDSRYFVSVRRSDKPIITPFNPFLWLKIK